MSSSRKGSISAKQNQYNTERGNERSEIEDTSDIGSDSSRKIQLISCYHKNMLKDYISSNSFVDPNNLAKIHDGFLNSITKIQNLDDLKRRLEENFQDVMERWLLTSMKNINFLVSSLKTKYEDEMEQRLENVGAGTMAPIEALKYHQSCMKRLKTSLANELANSIQNEPCQQHLEAFTTQIAKLWKQYMKSYPDLESDVHGKQIQGSHQMISDNLVHSEKGSTENITDGLMKNLPIRNNDKTVEKSILYTSNIISNVSGGLGRRNTVNLELPKKEERRLDGRVLETPEDPDRSLSRDIEQQFAGSSLKLIPPKRNRDENEDHDKNHAEDFDNNESLPSILKEADNSNQDKDAEPSTLSDSHEKPKFSPENEIEENINASSSTESITASSLGNTIAKDILTNNTVPPPVPPRTKTPKRDAYKTVQENKDEMWKGAKHPSKHLIPFDENTVAFYLSPDYMRYQQRTSLEKDNVWFEKTIISQLPNGEWEIGQPPNGKIWSLSELWEEEDRGISVGGSIMFKGHSHIITPEYILSVILLLVRKQHKTASGDFASKIIVGVPYWLNSRRRQQILNAADCAGFETCRIFNDNSLSAFHMYSNGKVPKDHELIIFSVNSNKIDVSVYRSNDFVTALLVGNCGNYEEVITSLRGSPTEEHYDSVRVQETQLREAINVALKKFHTNNQTRSIKRSVMICAKDELTKPQEDWIRGTAVKILNLQNVLVENCASFYGMLDIAFSRTFLRNEPSINLISDGRPFSVKFEGNRECFKTLSFDTYSLYDAPHRVEIPARYKTIFITEVNEPSITCRLGKLEIKNATANSEIVVDIGYSENGIFMIKGIRGRSAGTKRSLLYNIAYEWVPEDMIDVEKKPWYKVLMGLIWYG